MRRGVCILGASGSVGESTLKILRSFSEEFQLRSFSVHSNLEKAKSLALEFEPAYVCVSSEEADKSVLGTKIGKTQVLYGKEALCDLVRDSETETVVTAVVGASGIRPTVAAIEAGKKIGIANKETLVSCGPYIRSLLEKYNSYLVPVDSEHNALYQLLENMKKGTADRVVLTASGGPFRKLPIGDLPNVTIEQALKHPTWNMGPKITIDSAGMINKGLEVIEAHFLFGFSYDKIGVVIHPQSVAHGVVETKDGASFVYASYPDMIFPVAHALFYPKSVPSSLKNHPATSWGSLEFSEADPERYPGLGLAYEAGRAGGTAPSVFNAANEIAVESFLRGKILFTEIPSLIRNVLEKIPNTFPEELEGYEEADRKARELALSFSKNKVVHLC
ncbi:1-deoxy-D-xylulose-5-phosphate reductoisomerase [Leptospira wolffii]|uniref:1-deoxy-D-xylulose 5-phosphate reductoisomerase n=1 Tax=Leptospira wolffii TaxID=409998 RepID=A0A2M9ZBE2_9LEPT|nr:1-deoxy-D-xylulose-5-phosphate reductoisomerase [Leptospira wolffii]PJZ65667.1 1-deoxy-D-xylulose-5-phosphate reductoisomerase [Leptospira wolffii]TGK56120.1 1-deoxy-D-xylulose-5-phosphate reductoisomerase [Leptospira wolffii]TGK72166.1 1-deoxy-D-xylulose-5-phosphate reductoisomerase [Leptospira wolffii]TGK77470.1 1-deoxy-D-xylulose-5-phosphate reductoisomerase [Leptospira wolffii]TGL27743.1 1-deoxy-D-xylulose-5-phosphate reductoisomerase [Leptospira wolffii]